MKLIDSFMYHNEDLILDIRLNSLSKYVDKFIIIESKFDHQGNRKELNFDINKYNLFKNKIIYLVVENFPKTLSSWERENYQRNYILNGLDEFNDNDYVIVSDVDEIPDLSNLNNLGNFKYTVFEQKMFYYKFNLQNQTHPNWYGSKICKKKYLKSPQWLRNQKVKKYPFWRFDKIKWNIIKNGGWHFSFLMDAKKIRSKLLSYAHTEYNNDNYNNLDKINFLIKNEKDLFGRNMEYKKVNFDQNFPDYIVENRNKFKEWII